MYTNNNGDKSKRKQRTKLTDMGVIVIDDEINSTNGIREKDVSEQPTQQDAKRSLLNEGDAPLNVTSVDAREKRSRFKRVLIAGSVAASLLFVIFCLGYLWLSSNQNENSAYKVKPPAVASNKADEQTRGIKAEEISAELNKNKGANDSTLGSQNQTENASSGSPVTDRLPNEDLSATVKTDDVTNPQTNVATNSQVRSTGATTTSNNLQETNNSLSTVSPENNSSFVPTRSIRVSTLQRDRTEGNISENRSQPTDESVKVSLYENIAIRKTNSIVLPPFGTMLPIRTVGTVYTLRSDSYVRLQLTRDMSGQGWVLKRGTEFYGTIKNANVETGRAFISITGFIDPNTNRFVRLQGSVIGSDGVDGVKGRKHKLNSGWVNALKKVGREVLDTAKSAATGIGGRPVIITETSPRIADPIAEEISELALGRNGFVEITVGTACYLLVMTQPAEIQGVDADVSLSSANQSLQQNGLSEQELAELLTSGNKDEIRRALPRMTHDMRRVAEIFLSNK